MSDRPSARARRLTRRARWAAAGVLAFAAAVSWAAPDAAPNWTAEVGLTRATSSSPLYRLSPEGALVLLDGRSRLSGSLLETAISGQRDWAWADEWRPSVSARIDNRLSSQARDLEFGQVSLDATLRRPWGAGVAGVGVTWNRLWVSRQAFRTSPGLHVDWTLPQGNGGYVLLAYDRARYAHAAEFGDFDALAQQWGGSGRIEQPLPGISGIDIQAGWRREDNRRGQPDLSNRGRYLRVALDHERGVWQMSAAVMVNRTRYLAGVDDLLPARREQSLSLELGAAVDVGEGQTVKLLAQWSRNRARPSLYDNRYLSYGASYATQW